jgi:TonB family protein
MFETWQELEGKVIDEKFLLVHYLGGSGGNAAFVADGIGESSPSAIKFIPIDPQEPDVQLSRLRAAERLSHPNLIRLLDVGRYEADNHAFYYLRMEYTEENLGQFLPQRTLTVEETHQLLKPLLSVLEYLHAQGFVHGHLKPSNIMAIGDQVKLSSDGLCVAGEPARLDPQSIYTAPEAAEAAKEGITAATDVWSLGVTLLEALTGEPPVWNNERDDPAIPATLPPPFLEVVRHCLRRNPGQRWTLKDIAGHIRQVSAGPQGNLGAAARPTPSPLASGAPGPSSAPPRLSENRRQVVLALLAAVVVAALLVGFALRGNRSASEQDSATAKPSAQGAAQGSKGQDRQSAAPEDAQTPPKEEHSANEAARTAVPSGLKEAVPDGGQDGVIHRVMPNVSQGALNTIHGTLRVTVRVNVNPSGVVEKATFVSHGPSNYFAERSMQAAKLWQFAPPQAGGQNAGRWLLRFQYRNSGATVIPERQP